MNHQLVSVPYTDGDDITCKKLKECLAILLQYSPYREKDFTIRTAEGIHKKMDDVISVVLLPTLNFMMLMATNVVVMM